MVEQKLLSVDEAPNDIFVSRFDVRAAPVDVGCQKQNFFGRRLARQGDQMQLPDALSMVSSLCFELARLTRSRRRGSIQSILAFGCGLNDVLIPYSKQLLVGADILNYCREVARQT